MFRTRASFQVYKTDYRRQPFTYHPEIGWWALPNYRARLCLGNTYHRFVTNSEGIREERDFDLAPSKGWRIVVLGDSYSAGDGVDNGSRFSDLLQVRLPTCEIMNFGLNASGTDQQALIFEQFAMRYRPDLVIWGVCVENIYRNLCTHRPSWDYAEHRMMLRPKPVFVPSESGELILRNNPVPRESVEHAGGESCRLESHYNSFANCSIDSLYDRLDGLPWKLMSALMARAFRCDADLPFIVMPLPLPHHYLEDGSARYEKAFQKLTEARPGIFVADPLTAMRRVRMGDRRQFRFEDDPHFTVHAHAFLAEWLHQQLLLHCSFLNHPRGKSP